MTDLEFGCDLQEIEILVEVINKQAHQVFDFVLKDGLARVGLKVKNLTLLYWHI